MPVGVRESAALAPLRLRASRPQIARFVTHAPSVVAHGDGSCTAQAQGTGGSKFTKFVKLKEENAALSGEVVDRASALLSRMLYLSSLL